MKRNSVNEAMRARPPQIDRVFDILEELWGNESEAPALGHDEPMDGLMLTLLSQNTNDKNRDRGFAALKEKYPSWDMVASADAKDVEDAIRPAGLARTKSERMMLILKVAEEVFGEHSLSSLRTKEDDYIREFLVSLPGIGAKTAACVMLFDLGRPAFPVDTHIARFSRRMSWAKESTPPEKIQQLLESWLPPERFLGGHINIIEHGRGLCRARKPDCGGCPINRERLCPFAQDDPEPL